MLFVVNNEKLISTFKQIFYHDKNLVDDSLSIIH